MTDRKTVKGNEVEMKKDYIVELKEEEADELMNEHWVGELIRCKDCKFWNNDGIITTYEKHIGNGYPCN